mmetsp:Transcript_23482/g.59373  ORF Transcript_23482/g.59373 Transcript_23482/m.59373 type:complete len:313 (+) Transcript_23482:5742-6680(+)
MRQRHAHPKVVHQVLDRLRSLQRVEQHQQQPVSPHGRVPVVPLVVVQPVQVFPLLLLAAPTEIERLARDVHLQEPFVSQPPLLDEVEAGMEGDRAGSCPCLLQHHVHRVQEDAVLQLGQARSVHVQAHGFFARQSVPRGVRVRHHTVVVQDRLAVAENLRHDQRRRDELRISVQSEHEHAEVLVHRRHQRAPLLQVPNHHREQVHARKRVKRLVLDDLCLSCLQLRLPVREEDRHQVQNPAYSVQALLRLLGVRGEGALAALDLAQVVQEGLEPAQRVQVGLLREEHHLHALPADVRKVDQDREHQIEVHFQ